MFFKRKETTEIPEILNEIAIDLGRIRDSQRFSHDTKDLLLELMNYLGLELVQETTREIRKVKKGKK